MRTTAPIAYGIALAALHSLAVDAQTVRTPPFPMDAPQIMRTIEAVCTGVGADVRSDPRWATYPLRVEVAGASGEFLGAVQVTLTKGDEALASINCGGPWVLFKLMPGPYSVTAEFAGVSKTAQVNVGASGQARVILRFADPPSR